MKISVFGVCISPIVATALKEMLPVANVLGFEAAPVQRNQAIEAVEGHLADSDVVFCQEMPAIFGKLSYSSQKEMRENVFRLPTISFTGFHPDCVYLILDGKQHSSPLGPYNSALTAAAYGRGLSAVDTIQLFSDKTFLQLGYFDEFAKASSFLKAEFKRSNLDLDKILARSTKGRPFMHTINHPKGWFVRSVTQELACQAGLPIGTATTDDLLVDDLSFNAIWPVYPEIGAKLKLEGSYLFKKQGFPNVTTGASSYLDLREFVESSLNQYKDYPVGVFELPAVRRVATALNL
jgi:hypothetical protein